MGHTFDLDPVFTPAQARAAGLSRQRLESGPYRQVVRGVYAQLRTGDRAWVEAQAAVLVAAVDEAWASHHTAARLYSAVVPDTPQLHATVPPTVKRRRREGVVVHWGSGETRCFRGVRVSSPTQTFLDLSSTLDLVDLVVLGDSLVRRQRSAGSEAGRGGPSHAHGGGVRRPAPRGTRGAVGG
ncbi:hypothetical protein [Serinicoccus kebangsaanensis]|uniref:hypothetical protein n=1 Tax=Serinicoccus kebangsaanensis TaxID=2602069 RepID=UPI00124F3097|nr:hypothetical protein [Serinicoccus kebangsaanensis]